MPLSKNAIFAAIEQGALRLDPFTDEQVDRAHIDLHFGGSTEGADSLTIPALGFATALTEEMIMLSENLSGWVDGRASLARAGISIEQSSHFVEPGTNNKLTLEMFNASDTPYTLRRGQPIAKLVLDKLTDGF